MTTVGQTDEKPTGRPLFGHPIGLANLCGVELWERFSFYGMLTILGYYLYYSARLDLRRRPHRIRRAGQCGGGDGNAGRLCVPRR